MFLSIQKKVDEKKKTVRVDRRSYICFLMSGILVQIMSDWQLTLDYWEQTSEWRNKCEKSLCMNGQSGWGLCAEKSIHYTYLERIMAPRFTLAQDFRFFIPTHSTSIFAKHPVKYTET